MSDPLIHRILDLKLIADWLRVLLLLPKRHIAGTRFEEEAWKEEGVCYKRFYNKRSKPAEKRGIIGKSMVKYQVRALKAF